MGGQSRAVRFVAAAGTSTPAMLLALQGVMAWREEAALFLLLPTVSHLHAAYLCDPVAATSPLRLQLYAEGM